MFETRRTKYKRWIFSSFSYDLLKSEILFIEYRPPPHSIYVQNIPDLCKRTTWNSERDFKNQLIKPTKVFTHVVKKILLKKKF